MCNSVDMLQSSPTARHCDEVQYQYCLCIAGIDGVSRGILLRETVSVSHFQCASALNLGVRDGMREWYARECAPRVEVCELNDFRPQPLLDCSVCMCVYVCMYVRMYVCMHVRMDE